MPNLSPGTYVNESALPSYNPVSSVGGTFVFVGAHNRGKTTAPVLLRSWQEFVTLFGGFVNGTTPSTVALAVYSFFNNGGGQCYMLRIVHSDAVSAAQVLNSSAAVATLGVAAVNPGAWGNQIYVVVTQNTATNTFNLSVYYGGTAITNLVEPVWTNLSMNPADSRYAPSIVNNPNNGSNFIRLTDSNATPSSSSPLPVAATTQLGTGTGSTAGADGSAVTSTDLIGSQTLLNTITDPMVLNFPGVTDVTNVINPMISYCQTGRPNFADSFMVVDTPAGQSVSGAISYAGQVTASSYAAIYFPWVLVSDPSSTARGAVRTLPPGAFAMAKMATTDATRGVWKAPAGWGTSLSALSLEQYLQPADVGNLTAAGVNCLLFKQGAGIVIWGARTMSNVAQTLYINKRRTLIYIEGNLKVLSDYAVFEDNDFYLWGQLSQRIGTFLSQLWASGAFAGSTQANSFFITCDGTNNTPGASTVNISTGVALSDPAEFIQINVGQWQGGTSIAETPLVAHP